jgi:hypothetical protein
MQKSSWFLVLSLSVMSVSLQAYVYDQKYYEIKEIQVEELDSHDSVISEKVLLKSMPASDRKMNGGEFGQVIAVAKELVALGEDVYKLLNKGRPVVQTDYAPVSVIPKVAGKNVDPMDLENWSMPKTKKFKISYKNGFNMVVVQFDYMVIITSGGRYEGKGAYLTGVQIVPSNIHVKFGFDLSAVMKLQSVMNHGSKTNPVAGAILSLQYRVGNMMGMNESNDTIHVTGLGLIQEHL